MLPIDPDQVRQTIEHERFETVFQPMYSLHTGRVTGIEALTRVTGSSRGPGAWFAAARLAGLGVELELATARRALWCATATPDDVRVWLNLGVDALLDPRLEEVLTAHPVAAVGIDLTDAGSAADPAGLVERAQQLRRAGVRLAVGSEETTTRGVPRVPVDQVKVPLALTPLLEHRRSARRRARRVLAAAHRRGASVVAQGVETPAQLSCWTRLGADVAQGFLLAPPAPLAEALGATHLAGPAGAIDLATDAPVSAGRRG